MRPVAVAITGGIGAGKSEALQAFARHGAATISSDDIVHRLLREDEDVRAALIQRFGTGILDDAGNVDRAAISRIVFDDREALAWLEELLHPRVVAEYLAWREALAALPDPPAVSATEVPLLYEVGGEERFDAVVAITAPEDVRRKRSRVSSPEQRETRLIADDEKAARADFSYVNDGTRQQLDDFVAETMRALAARQPA
ncbi:MAG TPA: dephospho-CoA kinase [Gaiellaceae bacterium]|nr:dephospho-CoA kinase [Gaiellaceae bacterium]HKB20860.1 dephospho-CoA kinase [Gaiellaceae bacterium]